jgi:hypothetical protein
MGPVRCCGHGTDTMLWPWDRYDGATMGSIRRCGQTSSVKIQASAKNRHEGQAGQSVNPGNVPRAILQTD